MEGGSNGGGGSNHTGMARNAAAPTQAVGNHSNARLPATTT